LRRVKSPTTRRGGHPALLHLLPHISCDRITTYLQNGGTLEHVRQIAAHESPHTTKLYDRSQNEFSLDEVKRIRIWGTSSGTVSLRVHNRGRLARSRANWQEALALMKFERITVDPKVCTGKPCIRGLRFPVSRLLGLLAAGETRESILKAYPYLESEDIDEVLRYAAWLAEDETVELAG
jgi:uncharacterized protein (DUF433 family)